MGFLIANERTVGFYNDLLVIAVVDDGTLLAPGMELLNRINISNLLDQSIEKNVPQSG